MKTVKKVLIVILVLLLAAIIAFIGFFMFCHKKDEGDKASDGIEYVLNEDGSSYTVKGIGTCKSSKIVISETYNGMPVYSISENAFKDNPVITSVTVPASVKFIYKGAFYGCSSLTTITISSDETVIERGALDGTPVYNDENNWDGDAFYLGTRLIWAKISISGSYTVREGTTSVSGHAFEGCVSLTSITVVSSVTFIGEYAFYGCIALISITLSESIVYIGVEAFDGTAYFEASSNWSEGVLYIGKYLISVKVTVTGSFTIKQGTLVIAGGAFEGCTSITEIIIPDSVISIGDAAFSYCIQITVIVIPVSVTFIGVGAFEYCKSLVTITVSAGNSYYYSEGNCLIEKSSKTVVSGYGKTVVIPSGVVSIADKAFAGAEKLESVTIPDSVTFIGLYVFVDCTKLVSVTIPDGVTFIGSYTFKGCVSLTTVTISKTVISIGESAFEGCTGLTEVTVPDSVIYISVKVFAKCTSLVSIKLSVNITYIGDYVFEGCIYLVKIIYTGTAQQWTLIVKGTYWDTGAGDYDLEFNATDSVYGTYKFAYYTDGSQTVKRGEQGFTAETLVLKFNENGTFTLTATTPALIIGADRAISGTWSIDGNYILVAEGKTLTDVGVIDGNKFTILVNMNNGTGTIGFEKAD